MKRFNIRNKEINLLLIAGLVGFIFLTMAYLLTSSISLFPNQFETAEEVYVNPETGGETYYNPNYVTEEEIRQIDEHLRNTDVDVPDGYYTNEQSPSPEPE